MRSSQDKGHSGCTYMHSRYAGGLADCHKHQWLCYLLAQLRPVRYLETHAGAGCYSLAQSGRWQQGLAQLWPQLTGGLSDHWAQQVQVLNGQVTMPVYYPGSPWFARHSLGDEALTLFELDMETADQLREALPVVDVRTGDGFSSVVHLLESDCLLMVDPPYADLYDFDRALSLLSLVLQRQDCALMLWYPRFSDQREMPYLTQLEALLAVGAEGIQNDLPIWRNELRFATAQGSLCGSGVLVVGAVAPTASLQQQLNDQFARLGACTVQLAG
ncbi:MAG: 23S rRNA (adenine(2030)-N(6))-methyltransferase RlmJ [Marinobacterium sp.]|nr:23S rRNA (adenine(2030)-N(6))-methyltransferase RlmJ [Marinobacterium sp.]